MTRVQRQSEAFKHGASGNHSTAVKNVIKFINKHKPEIDVYEGWLVRYNEHFVRREKITWKPEHEYDIAINSDMRYILIDIQGESHGELGIKGHEQRKIKDGIAKKHAEESGNKYIALPKRELLGDREDVEVYLMQHLWKYIK